MERKRTKKAIGQKPSIINNIIDNAVSMPLNFSPTRDLAMWPPSSIAAGNKLSIVTIIPTQPAKATGCKLIARISPGPSCGIGPEGETQCPINQNSIGVGSVGAFSGITVK